ncbi:MAG: hypothetical protein U0802_14000 [Candidatus Binatia bacterium]
MQLVVGFGGYASAGAVLGRAQPRPAVLAEANARPVEQPRARRLARVCVAWAEAAMAFRAPTRWSAVDRCADPRRARGAGRGRAAATPAWAPAPGGARRAAFAWLAVLNRRAPELARAGARRRPRRGVAPGRGATARRRARRPSAAARVPARVEAYVSDIAAAYRWRIWPTPAPAPRAPAELAAAGLPALLVLYGNASGDHQSGQRRRLARATGAFGGASRSDAAAALAAAPAPLAGDPAAWLAQARRVRALARPDAADAVVAACAALL